MNFCQLEKFRDFSGLLGTARDKMSALNLQLIVFPGELCSLQPLSTLRLRMLQFSFLLLILPPLPHQSVPASQLQSSGMEGQHEKGGSPTPHPPWGSSETAIIQEHRFPRSNLRQGEDGRRHLIHILAFPEK